MRINSFVKILLIMIVGGFVGFGGAVLLSVIANGLGENNIFTDIANFTIENILWIQSIFLAVIIAVNVFNYLSIKKLLGTEKQLEDTDEDINEEIAEKIDLRQTFSLTLSSINYICSFILFGMSIDSRNELRVASIVVFLAAVAFSITMEIFIVNHVKKRDPLKKGDPADLDFDKQWINSCDEAEQMLIYKAAFKCFGIMKSVLLTILVLVFFSKIFFGTGNFPIIIVGLIWLIMILSYTYYGYQLQNEKINM